MFTRPLNPRMGPQRTGNKRQELIQQIARQKAAGVQRKFPAITRGAKERFGAFGQGPKSMGGARPIFGQGGSPGARDFLPMPGFDRPHGHRPDFGLAPVEPGLPGGAPDFVQQVQDRFVGLGAPQGVGGMGSEMGMRPDASGPINWAALGIQDPNPTQTLSPAYQPMQSPQFWGGSQAIAQFGGGVGQAPNTAGGLIPLGGGQYLDPSTGVVHGVGGLGMM